MKKYFSFLTQRDM